MSSDQAAQNRSRSVHMYSYASAPRARQIEPEPEPEPEPQPLEPEPEPVLARDDMADYYSQSGQEPPLALHYSRPTRPPADSPPVSQRRSFSQPERSLGGLAGQARSAPELSMSQRSLSIGASTPRSDVSVVEGTAGSECVLMLKRRAEETAYAGPAAAADEQQDMEMWCGGEDGCVTIFTGGFGAAGHSSTRIGPLGRTDGTGQCAVQIGRAPRE